MAMEKDCKVVTTLSGIEYIRALAEDGSTVRIPVSELGKVLAQVMPVATIGKNGLLGGLLFDLSFTVSSLPNSAENKIGNHDNMSSGYGYYNNVSDNTGEFAPGWSAGFFLRFKFEVLKGITFFMPSYGSLTGKMLYRFDGENCNEIV